MDFLAFSDYNHRPENTNFMIKTNNNQNNNKRRKTQNCNQDFSTPLKQRSQANARERDRTHRYFIILVFMVGKCTHHY